MTDEEKTNIFITLYLAAKRGTYRFAFSLKEPAKDSEQYKNLDKARRIVDDLGGDYSDFIRVQFEAFRFVHCNAAPKPENLITDKAIKRYIAWQKRKNKFITQTFTIEGDSFYVKATGRKYPIYRVEMDSFSDPDSSYALFISKSDSYENLKNNELKEALDAIEYQIAKLTYKGKPVIQSLIKAREKLKCIMAKK